MLNRICIICNSCILISDSLSYFDTQYCAMSQCQMYGIGMCVFSIATVAGEDPEFVRAKFFFRDEFLVRFICIDVTFDSRIAVWKQSYFWTYLLICLLTCSFTYCSMLYSANYDN